MKNFRRLLIEILFIAIFLTMAIISIITVTNNGAVSLIDVVQNIADYDKASSLGESFSAIGTTNVIALVVIILSVIGLLLSILSFFLRKTDTWIFINLFFATIVLALGIYVAYKLFGKWPTADQFKDIANQIKTNTQP